MIAHGGRAVEAAVLVKRRGRPLIVWQRILGFPEQMWRPMRRFRWRMVVRRVDAAVALTPDLGDELGELGFTGPIWAIPNFRDPEPFVAVDRDVAAHDLRVELGLADDVGLVGFVGHLIEQKRPDRALDALVAMHELGENAHLVVAGDGPLRASFERDVAERGLGAYVHVLGHRDDIAQILAAIDVFILTSDAEGLPGVLIEAQMAGCPVVTVPVGGVRDLVDDGETGVVIDEIDHRELAARVVGLLRDPAAARPSRRTGPPPRRALLLQRGREHVRRAPRRGARAGRARRGVGRANYARGGKSSSPYNRERNCCHY